MRRSLGWLSISFLFIVGQGTLAQACGSFLGRLPAKPYGSLRSATVSGNYAYAGNGLVLTVLNISDPSSPVVVREMDLPSDVDEGELIIAGGYLFVPLTSVPLPAALKVYSLADPENPVEVGALSGLSGLRGGIELQSGLLYAADGSGGGLRIIDVSPPSSPTLVGSLPMEEARDVTLYPTALATYAYVADQYDGVHVVDVTNPALPAELDPPVLLPTGDGAESVSRSGEYLFVSAANSGLRIYSLADPEAPSLVASLPTAGLAEWVTIQGTRAFVCCSTGGLDVLDISVPSAPVPLGHIGSLGMTFHVALSGTTALVSEAFGGLRLVDVSDPAAMNQLAVWDLSEESSVGLWVEGSYAYVPRYAEGLAVLDVSTPTTPSQVGLWLNPRRTLTGVAISGGVAYVTNPWRGLYTVDTTTPNSPVLLGEFTGRRGYHVAVSGNYAYLAAIEDGLAVLDVSDPAHPNEVGICDTPGSARWVDLALPYAYIADMDGGLRILDVSSPSSPVEVGQLATPEAALGIKVLGGRAYVGASGSGLRIVDVSNPAAPLELGFYDTPGSASRVDVSGSVALVADGAAGVQVVDVSDPANPALMGTVDTPGVAREVRLVGETLYIADYFGVVVESLASCCSGPPGTPMLVAPAPGAGGQACALSLDWSDAPQALSYDLYFDTVNPPLALSASGLGVSSFDVPLTPGTTYYWKVVAHNGCGATESEVASFATAPVPGAFSLLSPLDGRDQLLTTVWVWWSPSPGAESYRLYLGTSDPPPLYAADLTGNDTTVSGLMPGTTYYMTMVAVSPCGETPVTEGVISFTTACPTLAGRWPEKFMGALRSMALNGNYAYFTDGGYLTVLDVSDPAAPVLVSEIATLWDTMEGSPVIGGGYLFLPLNSRLKVFSLANPASPLEVASLSGFVSLHGMELAGGILYASDSAGGLRIIDVSVPASPTLVGSYPTPDARDVALYSLGPIMYAYVGGYGGPLVVLDVTNPAAPALVATIPLDAPQEVEAVTRVGDHLYLADGEWGLRILSLADPAAPVQVSLSPPVGYLEWVTVAGNRAYACDGGFGLRVFDVTDPSDPTPLGGWDSPGYPFYVAVDGDTAFLADHFAGLRILDVSSPGSIVELAYYDDSNGMGVGLASNGQTTFLAAEYEGLVALDVTSLPTITHLSSTPSPGPFGVSQSVTLRGDLALLSVLWDGLILVDVTDPSTPVERGIYLEYPPLQSAVWGDYAYIVSGSYGLVAVDIHDPSAPVRVGRYNTPGYAQWVSVRWPFAFVADGNQGLRVINVTDPAAPAEVGSATTPSAATGVALTDGHALVAASGSGLRIFDISNPSAPSEVGAYPMAHPARRVHVSGSVASVSDGYGIRLVDISAPAVPTLVGSFDTLPGNAVEGIIVGNQAQVADIGRFYVEDLSSCCSGGPGTFSLLYPADGEPDAPYAFDLDWSDAFWALRYDIYLDTVNPPTHLELSGLTISRLHEVLAPGTTYYWKVVAHNPCGSTESPVYSFTVGLPNLAVTSYDATPAPVLTGQQVTLTLSFTNQGASPATGVTAIENLALSGTAAVTFEAGASDPRWAWDEGTLTLTANLGTVFEGNSDSLTAVFTTSGIGSVSGQIVLVELEADGNPANNTASASAQITPLAIGDRVWRDDDADGIQDPGEPGLAGVVVKLYNDSNQMLQEVVTDPSGMYQLRNLSHGALYFVKYFLPSPDYVFSPKDRGTDDTADSDADPLTGQTSVFALTDGLDPARWDCGMVSGALCVPPDERVWIYQVTLSDPEGFPILNFMDPNQANQVTGYNIYRTHDSSLPHGEWTLVASNVRDMDEATPNKQWVDISGDDPPPGYTVWYYQVAAFSSHCPPETAEGPW